MAIKLDHPYTGERITHQGVTRFEVVIPHKRNADDTDLIIDKPRIYVRYQVTTWDAVGNVVATASRTEPAANWPTVVKREMQLIYSSIQTDAINNNLIGEGVDELM